MSWFDASGFANLAKSALKEAQKTIDKALDIKDDEQKQAKPTPSNDSVDFFASWGLKSEEEEKEEDEETQSEIMAAANQEQQTNSNSVWGSFTGSFFESPKLENSSLLSNIKHSKSLDETPEIESDIRTHISASISVPENIADQNIDNCTTPTQSEHLDLSKSTIAFEKACSDTEGEEIATRRRKKSWTTREENERKDRRWSCEEGNVQDQRDCGKNRAMHRISVFSSESDKRSSESVEVLGSRSSSTTTPDSDVNMIGISSSSSSVMCLKVGQSESVEILPGSSMTSPSSVEILGDWKSEGSPYLSPMQEQGGFEGNLSGEGSRGNYDISLPTGGQMVDMTVSCTDDNMVKESLSEEVKTSSGSIDVSENLLDVSGSTVETTDFPIATLKGSTSSRNNSQGVQESTETVAPDVDESEEISLAEDSYTSVSESTVMTILENREHQQDFIKSNLKLSDGSLQAFQPSDYSMNLSSEPFKDRLNVHVPVEPNVQLIRKSDIKKVSETDASKGPPVVEVPEQFEKSDTNECTTDQYLMSTDSSCEGTLIESSSEDNATMCISSSSSQSKIPEAPLTASSYVKSMLADAMSEKSENADSAEKSCAEVPRENSPISSESRSDLVKIGSDQTSGHTSGDELETTTSSDIEIISSPNGDSSSTTSRQSPAKVQLSRSSDLLTRTLKTRGHSRELSEISIGSDDANSEIDKLLKRIQEMTEILEARESKLIDVSRVNMELHEQNNNLKKQLDNAEKHVEHSQDLCQITDEYTQRLSALERKFQQAIRERDTLRKTVEQLKQEASLKMSSVDISTMNAEKDETIRELREEGEKLSKQQLQHSNIIKKLRIKEKESDATVKNQKDLIEEHNLELDRLKRSLNAKEEVERSQIEAVHTLTAKTKKQEKEILSLQENLDMALNKMDVYKKSLDAAKAELMEMSENLRIAEDELKRAVENAGQSCQLSAQVEDLKMKLRQAEETCIRKEESLKQENAQLLLRLEAAEMRSEELSESASTATKPLLRQLEQLQANLLHKSNSFMKQERILSDKIIELQSKLESFVQSNQTLKEDNLALKRKVSMLESKLNSKKQECDKLMQLNEELKVVNGTMAEENKRHEETNKMLEKSYSCQVTELKRTINALENKLAIEKAATDAEKRKNHAFVESQQQQLLQQQQSIDEEMRLSPTLSIERESVSSASSIVWPAFNDPMFESSSGRFPNVYESLRSGNTTTTIENLQAQLKQKEGEVQQIQWELSRRNAERNVLNGELSSLSLKVESLNAKITEMETLNENLNDIQTKYDALLQMYGEKVEENQELRLDLQDVKEMYKTQIDQLLKRD